MPVLGDRPVLGKQQAGAGAVYYIVIPHKSLIFRGFGHMHLAVLQSASFRIIRIRTHFRHFRNGPAVYGLHVNSIISSTNRHRLVSAFSGQESGLSREF